MAGSKRRIALFRRFGESFPRGGVLKAGWLYPVIILLASAMQTSPVFPAEEPGGSGMSCWGEIPPENEENRSRFEDNRRPLWENLLYYPYQVIAFPVRSLAWGASSTAVWAGRPEIYRTARDIVTLESLPVEGSVGVNLGGGDGLGGSYSLTHPHFLGKNNRFKLGLGYTTERNSRATVGVLLGDGHTTSLEMGGGYRLKPNTRFYGIGHDSPEAGRSYFTNEVAWLGAEVQRSLGGATVMKVSGIFSTATSRGPLHKKVDALEVVFSGVDEIPPGYGTQSEGAAFGVSLEDNTTDQTGRPRAGHVWRLGGHRFDAGDESDLQFWTTRAEAQHFLPLWHTGRTLTLRGFYSRLHSEGADPVPFQRLLSNDDPDLMRGFHDQRFRDEGLLACSIEYRFPAWNYKSIDGVGLDAFLFWDGGQVFGHSNEIALRNLRHSYGAGFRYISSDNGFGGCLEVGFSDEDMVIRIGAEQLFQFAKGGLLHGRNPIPQR